MPVPLIRRGSSRRRMRLPRIFVVVSVVMGCNLSSDNRVSGVECQITRHSSLVTVLGWLFDRGIDRDAVAAHRLRGVLDRLDDVLIARAAAEVALKTVA